MSPAPFTSSRPRTLIIGAGPSGLSCGYELLYGSHGTKAPKHLVILDRNEVVGGLARSHRDPKTQSIHDVGPHRFFTKNREVQALWEELLGDDLLTVTRLTRILYKNRLFRYPIQASDVVMKLGPSETTVALLSFLYARAAHRQEPSTSFEDWITKRFGSKLYRTFFKTYTEKVWGIPCTEIGAEWAAQRIKNLNFTEVIKRAVGFKSEAKTLVEQFHYPRNGTGQVYEVMADRISERGGEIRCGWEIRRIAHQNGTVRSVTVCRGTETETIPVDTIFSSMPLSHLIDRLDPAPPPEVLEANNQLYYRDHITANFVIRGSDLFPDNWIYVHTPDVQMARVANYSNFSPAAAPQGKTALGVEYFAFQHDTFWPQTDAQILTLAEAELRQTKLLKPEHSVESAFTVRETEVYPTYYLGHRSFFDTVKGFVDQFSNLQPIGRGGMYKYNNMDHSMYTGMLAARNYRLGTEKYDIWAVNEDAEYHEEVKESRS